MSRTLSKNAPAAKPAEERRSNHAPELVPAVNMEVKVISDPDALQAYLPAWKDLAAAAVEPNPFYEPWMLLSALRNFGAGKHLRCVLILQKDPAQPAQMPALCGLFPFERHRHYGGLPLSIWSGWKYPHCYLATPLIRAETAGECLATLFDWLRSETGACSALEWKHVHGEGRFDQLLADQLTDTRTIPILIECFTRALFKPMDDADRYLSEALSAKSRSTLRRKFKLLSAIGPVEYTVLERDGDLESAIESFLRIEASGWKGREGSALNCRDAHRKFFTEVATEAFQNNRLLMPTLLLNRTPVAQNSYFFSGRGAFLFKPAFDEQYARFSPGLHLECETIRRLHRAADVDWMDSCTAHDNDMYNRLFLGRRVIQSLLIPIGTGLAGCAVSMIPLLRTLKDAASPMIHSAAPSSVKKASGDHADEE